MNQAANFNYFQSYEQRTTGMAIYNIQSKGRDNEVYQRQIDYNETNKFKHMSVLELVVTFAMKNIAS